MAAARRRGTARSHARRAAAGKDPPGPSALPARATRPETQGIQPAADGAASSKVPRTAGPAPPLRESLDYIEQEVGRALGMPQRNLDAFLDALAPAKRVFLYGRGRSGFVARAFAVRLMHLGYQTFVVGETITAPVRAKDVVILVSGSGSTYPVVMTAELGRKLGAKVVAVTANPDSEIARLAHIVLSLQVEEGNGKRPKLAPLGTLFETSAWLFFDAVVALLMERLGEDEESMRKRHATLE